MKNIKFQMANTIRDCQLNLLQASTFLELTTLFLNCKEQLVEYENASGDRPFQEVLELLEISIPGFMMPDDLYKLDVDLILNTIRKNMPLETIDNLMSFQVYKLFHSYFMSMDRLRTKERNQHEQLERFWTKITDRFIEVSSAEKM